MAQFFFRQSEFIRELQHRFDELPIHRFVYYQSYNHGVLQKLIAVINMRLRSGSGIVYYARSNRESARCSWYDPPSYFGMLFCT
jgi:hypothetical protein